MNNFSKLGLSSSTIDILDKIGFVEPTPVQDKAIPLLLENNPTDFIGLAQTGTGKTAAFGLPLIELIDSSIADTQAIIMAPTRELGQQTAKQIVDFAKNDKRLNVVVVYGGAAIVNQMQLLKKPTQIIVATPGRLLDLIKRKAVNLAHIKYVILDEADEMLNMGFKEDLDEILSYTPENRVTWLFSATMPSEIRRIVSKFMHNPLEVSINSDERVNKDISHKYVTTKVANKLSAIRRFLDIQPDMRGIMFCRTKRETQQIADDLGSLGYSVEALHGDLSQQQRDAVMKRFKTRSMQLLIATDVAARGIDVNDLTHVLHHTLPDQLDAYTHRSGRTARAGKKGISIAFINPREGRRIKELEKKNKLTFERIDVPSIEELRSSRINNWANLIINTEVDEQAEEILKKLHGQFEHLTKEDLLKRLITSQIDHSLYQSGESSDLNETVDNGSTRERTKKGDKKKYHRYFVNLGFIDGLTKGDLIHFLSDISGVKRSYFGEIDMQNNCTFFDVDSSQDDGFGKSFRGTEVEGRFIRVNRDDEGGKRSRSVSYKSPHKKSGHRKKTKSDSAGFRKKKKKK